MPHYEVTWMVEICDATDPRDAAMRARQVFVEHPDSCPFMYVHDRSAGFMSEVDLTAEPFRRVRMPRATATP